MSILDQILGSIEQPPTPEEMIERMRLDLDLLDRMWGDKGDKDCEAVMAFTASARRWYIEFMGNENADSRVTRSLHEAIGGFMEGIHKTLHALEELGRTRCDAIEAATGTNPLSVEEEKRLREECYHKFHQPQPDTPTVGDAGWVNAAESAG